MMLDLSNWINQSLVQVFPSIEYVVVKDFVLSLSKLEDMVDCQSSWDKGQSYCLYIVRRMGSGMQCSGITCALLRHGQ